MLYGVVPGNPNLKEFVGNFIYPYVVQFVGKEQAGFVTALLIGLDNNTIKDYLYDFEVFKTKV